MFYDIFRLNIWYILIELSFKADVLNMSGAFLADLFRNIVRFSRHASFISLLIQIFLLIEEIKF